MWALGEMAIAHPVAGIVRRATPESDCGEGPLRAQTIADAAAWLVQQEFRFVPSRRIVTDGSPTANAKQATLTHPISLRPARKYSNGGQLSDPTLLSFDALSRQPLLIYNHKRGEPQSVSPAEAVS